MHSKFGDNFYVVSALVRRLVHSASVARISKGHLQVLNCTRIFIFILLPFLLISGVNCGVTNLLCVALL